MLMQQFAITFLLLICLLPGGYAQFPSQSLALGYSVSYEPDLNRVHAVWNGCDPCRFRFGDDALTCVCHIECGAEFPTSSFTPYQTCVDQCIELYPEDLLGRLECIELCDEIIDGIDLTPVEDCREACGPYPPVAGEPEQVTYRLFIDNSRIGSHPFDDGIIMRQFGPSITHNPGTTSVIPLFPNAPFPTAANSTNYCYGIEYTSLYRFEAGDLTIELTCPRMVFECELKG